MMQNAVVQARHADDGQSLCVAAIQMVSTPDVAENLLRASRLIEAAANDGAALIGLPEYFCLMGRQDTDKVQIAEQFGHGTIQDWLAELSGKLGVWLIAGTLPLATEDPTRVRNACIVFGPDGRCHSRYDKVHLFQFERGEERFDEGRTIEAGDTVKTVTVNGFKVGLSICYDLRFPELYRAMGPVDLIMVPSAFTYTTGKAHWETLLKARAIENQCYVLAPAQGGIHPTGRRTFGHSMLIDPWGEVVQVVPEGEGHLTGRIEHERIRSVRQQLPALHHRRLTMPETLDEECYPS